MLSRHRQFPDVEIVCAHTSCLPAGRKHIVHNYYKYKVGECALCNLPPVFLHQHWLVRAVTHFYVVYTRQVIARTNCR